MERVKRKILNVICLFSVIAYAQQRRPEIGRSICDYRSIKDITILSPYKNQRFNKAKLIVCNGVNYEVAYDANDKITFITSKDIKLNVLSNKVGTSMDSIFFKKEEFKQISYGRFPFVQIGNGWIAEISNTFQVYQFEAYVPKYKMFKLWKPTKDSCIVRFFKFRE